jgi:hypothetical protein
MAEVEWDHEHYFRLRVQEHFIGRHLPIWTEPPPKESIRISFERDVTALPDPGAATRVTVPTAIQG